jgi:hypothetical protein
MGLELNEIISQDQIESILMHYTAERQLLELKFYLLQHSKELRELGIDPRELAWKIYKTNQK